MRDLKTIPCGVLTYGARKTKNVMTSREKARLGDAYDKDEDAYRNCYEEIAISHTPSAQMITQLDDSVEAGRSHFASDPNKAADGTSRFSLGRSWRVLGLPGVDPETDHELSRPRRSSPHGHHPRD